MEFVVFPRAGNKGVNMALNGLVNIMEFDPQCRRTYEGMRGNKGGR